MKVNIKKYPTWIGPYQIVAPLRYVGVKEETRDRIAEWISESSIGTLLNKFHEWKISRRVSVKIHPHDAWNADSTLAYVILPVLKEIQRDKHGSPSVDDEDVPEELKSTSAPPKENEWDTDENWHLRWEYVLNEMIWAFEQIDSEEGESQFWIENPEIDFDSMKPSEGGMTKVIWKKEGVLDKEGLKAYRKRLQTGLILFGKYYQSLWT